MVDLFKTLRANYPNAQEFRSKNAFQAWCETLEPFAYEDVKAATLDWSRKYTYPPHAPELAVAVAPPPPEDTTSTSKRAATGSGYAWQKYIEDNHLEQDDAFSVSRYAREHGLSWPEAKAEALRLGLYQPPA